MHICGLLVLNNYETHHEDLSCEISARILAKDHSMLSSSVVKKRKEGVKKSTLNLWFYDKYDLLI